MEPVTFLDKIEVAFADTKAWLIKEFGDHMSVHNAIGDLKMKILTSTAEHFGDEPTNPTVAVPNVPASPTSSTDSKAP